MEFKKDPFLLAFAAVILLGIGFLIYTHRVSWEMGVAFFALYLAPSVLGRKSPPTPVLLLVALGLSACAGREAQRAKNAVDLAGYQQALDDCRKQGVMSKSFDVYEACARAADLKYGRREAGDGR